MCRHDHPTPATPDQTLTIAGDTLPIHDADIPPQWSERARRKVMSDNQVGRYRQL